MSAENSVAQVAPLGSYSKVRQAGGLIFVAGTTARKADGSVAGVSVDSAGRTACDISAQTRFALEEVRKALASVGAGLEDCIDVTVFLTDMRDFQAFNACYAEFFPKNGPTRTTVAVLALPHPDMVIEFKVIAGLPSSRNTQ
jgi:2-aminomuconate deaminase